MTEFCISITKQPNQNQIQEFSSQKSKKIKDPFHHGILQLVFFRDRYNQPVANQSAKKKQNSEYRIFFLYIENRVSFDYWQSKAGRFF